jgi:hypothetical protein
MEDAATSHNTSLSLASHYSPFYVSPAASYPLHSDQYLMSIKGEVELKELFFRASSPTYPG